MAKAKPSKNKITNNKAKATPLPRGLTIFPDRGSYVLRVGKKFSKNKAYRRYFKTEGEARAEAAKLAKEENAEATAIKETGLSAIQLAEIRVALGKLDGKSLLDAVSFFETRAVTTTISLKDACTKIEEMKKTQGLGGRHLNDIRKQFAFFNKTLGKINIGDVLKSDVEKIINTKDGHNKEASSSRQAKRLRYFRIITNEALAQGWIKIDPTLGIKTKKEKKEELVVLTPRQIASLLIAAKTKYPDLVAAIAIKIFCGVRNPELLAMTWADVKDAILVKAAFTKTGRTRSISLSYPLKSWLDLIPKEMKEGALPIYPIKKTRKDRMDSWNIDQKAIAESAGIVPWPQNCLRHAFGTYHYAEHKDEALTAYEMGNSPSVIKQHYVTGITVAESEEFWALTPSYCESLLKKPDAPHSQDGPPTPTKVRRSIILPPEWEERK